MVYQWKTRLYAVDAQEAGEELERIQTKSGSLTAHNVVEASRDSGAVLHGCFEWDDTKAAEQHREYQARVLIGNIVAVKIEEHKLSSPVRAFISVVSDDTNAREYKPLNVVLASKDYTSQMLEMAKAELNSFREKYSALEELSEIFEAIERFNNRTV